MARRALGPFVVILVLAGLALLGARLQSYELDYTNMCTHRLAELDQPAADILFIGNSRMGASIDPLYIGDEISSALDETVAVERLTLTNNDLTPFRAFTGDYVRNRGFPKIVVLQLTYNRERDLQDRIDMPVNPPRNLAFARMADMQAMQDDVVFNDHGARVSRRLERGYRGRPAMELDRLTMNIYAALRYPAHRITGRPTTCEGEFVHRQADIWLYGNLDGHRLAEPWPEPDPADLAEWRAIVADYLPLDPDDPMRTFENDQIAQLVTMLRAGGSRVYLTVLPSLDDGPLSDADKAALARRFPDAPLIDLGPLYAREGDAGLALAYRDEDHVNIRGAAAISHYFAQVLAERYP